MAAYAAVVSLQHTINGLINSSSYSRVSSSREILESAYEEASSLLQVLERLNGKNRSRSSMERVDALEAQIRDSAHKLEDFLEFHQLKQLEEEEEDEDEEGMMTQEIRSFDEAAKRLGKEYLAELSKDDDGGEDYEYATYPDFGVEMIGRSRLFSTILKRDVISRMRPHDRCLFSFFGEQGSGSRVVAKTVFDNAREAGKFERFGWVTVGRGYEPKHVLMSLIAQIEGDVDDGLLVDASEDRLSECLYKALENQSYMIVLDGTDDMELLDYLRSKSFPDQSNGSVVFVATTSQEVVQSSHVWFQYVLPDVYEEENWLLLRHVLFGRGPIPAGLEVAGRKIVRVCKNRLITLAKTLVFLSKSDKTVEQWSKIAAEKDNPIFTVADEISEKSEIQKEMESYETKVAQVALPLITLSTQVEGVTMSMYPQRFFSKLKIISFFGMAGIGKTAFARNIFENHKTLSNFDHLVWIPMGPRYRTKEILRDILAQIYPHVRKLHMNEKLVGDLCAQVSNKRCLIVLDDLCSHDPLHHLREIFPAIKGTILVTTRQPKVAKFGRDDRTIEMQLLNQEESWCLLRRKVFDGGECPPELEKAGRKIVEKCDGLPLFNSHSCGPTMQC